MAKSAFAPPKPVYRDGGYTGILFFTLLAMGLGIGLLAWECNDDYDWNAEGSGIAPAQTVKSLVEAERNAPAPQPPVPVPMVPPPMGP
jgi:hypothetical protein